MVDGGPVNNGAKLSDRRAAQCIYLAFAVCAAAFTHVKPVYADEQTPSASESATTSADDSIRNITIEMESLSFEPTAVSVTAGETVRFVLKNTGDIPHEFTIGTPLVQSGRRAVMRELFDADILQEYLADAPDREGPNSVVILGGETRELVWTFTETQDIEFGCNLPLHYEAGMRGDIHVTVPPKSNAVAAHEHSDDSGGAGTNGLANLAQLMAKAKEAVNGDADAGQSTDSDQPGKSDDVATSDASGAATPGKTPDTTSVTGAASEANTTRTEASAPGETAADNGEGDNTKGEQTEGGQSEEEKGMIKSTPPTSATVSVKVRAPEYRAFDRGLALMSDGDILGARVEFEKSATAESALALGRSYDEKYLSRIENSNAEADAATARQWYEAWYRISVRQGAISAETNLDLLIKAMTNE